MSNIILSVFKRKGGEGGKTKIITNENIDQYKYLYEKKLIENETGLIIYYYSNDNWILYSNKRIIVLKSRDFFSIYYSEIAPLGSEKLINAKQQDGKYPLVIYHLKDKNGKNYVIDIESGEPFNGIIQILYLFG